MSLAPFAHRTEGGSLRFTLLALVMVPLLGVGGFAAGLIGQRRSLELSASSIQADMRCAVVLNAASSALYQELLAEMELLPLSDSAEATATGLPSGTSGYLEVSATAATARAASDAALAAAAGQLSVRPVVMTVLAQLRAARVRLDAQTMSFAQVTSVVGGLAKELTKAKDARIEIATAAGLRGPTVAALRDVLLVAHAVDLAQQAPSLFASSQLGATSGAPALRRAWLVTWGALQAASADVEESAAPPVRAAWSVLSASAPFARFDQMVSASVADPSPPGSAITPAVLGSVLTATSQPAARNAALTSILVLVADRASASAASQRDGARLATFIIMMSGLFVLLSSIGVATLAYRSLAKPLNGLAAQAKQVSEGELPDVAVGGPREVRTVARGLSAAVASLRRIQHQAAAVSAGQLDDTILREPLPGPLGRVVHASVTTIIDAVRERDEAQRTLAHVASHDALTELPNRAEALVAIARALHRGQRRQTTTGLLFIDLDRFKQVNDSFGHAAGDVVLQIAAQRMLDVIRSGDTLARLGGDEFVILVEDVSNAAEFVELAERLVADLSGPMDVGAREVSVGASVGVSMCRDGYVDPARLLHEADAAVYKAKGEGRGRVGIFDDDLRRTLDERAVLEAALSNALAEQEFVLHYQPVVDLGSGRTLGVEALVRWNRPGHGMVAPDSFIPTAELSNRINEIGRWVLGEATRQLAAWTASDPDAAALTMAVNVSGRHLISNTLVDDVRVAVEASGIDPSRLVVEITETVLVDNPTAALTMQELRATGVKIAIDDFGTGFTSIGQLPLLPVDTLKIDRSFVSSEDPAQQELVRLIISAAHAFDLTVVAEGVEHAHQMDSLRNAAAEVGQGFYFSRPQPAASLNPSAIETWAGGGTEPTDRLPAL